MAEYIERGELASWLKKAGKFLKIEEDHKRVCHVIGKIIDHIEAMPASDVVEVRHGKWIEDHEFFKCSECGYLTDYRLSNFCPDCGARMDGEDGNNND